MGSFLLTASPTNSFAQRAWSPRSEHEIQVRVFGCDTLSFCVPSWNISSRMRVVVETGTDVAMLGIGDLSLLSSLEQAGPDHFEKAREKAVEEGRMWCGTPGGDGAYLFHLFIDEQPPRRLTKFLRDPLRVENFPVQSGRVYVGGAEFFLSPERGRSLPHMGREIEVPPGNYQLTAFRVDAPDEYVETAFDKKATPQEQRLRRLGNDLPAFCIMGTLVALPTSWLVYEWNSSLLMASLPLLVAAAAWGGLWMLFHSAKYKMVAARYHELAKELPSIVITLRTNEKGE